MLSFQWLKSPYNFGLRFNRGVAFANELVATTMSMYPEVEDLSQMNTIETQYSNVVDTITEDDDRPYSRSKEPESATSDLPTATPTGLKAKRCRPSVVPAKNFNPVKDAEFLVKALTSYGSNGEVIIAILTNRTLKQRNKISEAYATFTGINLVDDFKREIFGKFRTLLLALMIPSSRLFAIELRRATRGLGTDENALIEILTTLSNNEMKVVRKEYFKVFRRHLEEDVRHDTSGPFRRLLLLLIEAKRSESTDVNKVKAKHFAKMLYRAGELRFGVDKETFITIFCRESFPQLNEIFKQYEILTGNDIDEIVESEFTFDLEKGLRAIIQVTRNKQVFYAECLYKAMKGLGTDNGALVRIMVSRSEIDLIDIAESFFMLYGERLESWIEDDNSDHFQNGLLALLRPKLPEKISTSKIIKTD